MVIFKSLLTTLMLRSVFEAAEAVAKISSSLEPNSQIKLSKPKSLTSTVDDKDLKNQS